MSYELKAHPTKYKHVLFRSRLEARWAAFFDLYLWRWEYEPIDLVGWTPDFRLNLSTGSVLAEVKPWDSQDVQWLDVVKKIEKATHGEEVLLLNTPTQSTYLAGEPWFDGDMFGEFEELWAEAGNLTQWRLEV